MSESRMYNHHLTEHALERKKAHLGELKCKITLWSLLSALFGISSLLCLGYLGTQDTLVAQDGCNISLGLWYTCIFTMCLVKTTVTSLRHYIYRRHSSESVVTHIGGNFILMPLIFFGFFIWTQMLSYQYNSPEHTGLANVVDIGMTNPYQNECMAANVDSLSTTMYVGFRIGTFVSFLGIFYYMTTTCMLI